MFNWMRKKPEPETDLRDEIRELTRRVDQVELNCDEWYDNMRRLLAKISKRAKVEEAAQAPPAANHQGQPVTGRPLSHVEALRARREG